MRKIFSTFLIVIAFAANAAPKAITFPSDAISEIEMTFSYKWCHSPVIFTVSNAGVISDCSFNGKDYPLKNMSYPYTGHNEEQLRIQYSTPKMEVRVRIKGVTSETRFKWVTEESMTEFHPKVKIKVLNTVHRKNILRVVDWNIQNGMWAGQEDNYDRFVEYMKEMDADVCIFCESQTIYYNGTKDFCRTTEQYLPYKYREYTKKIDPGYEPEGWLELAARFGHKYVQVGAHKDDYPVIVTSKYPITLVQKLGGEGISHGGIHAQVTFRGETVNLVGFHTYPHAFGKGVKGDQARAESKARHEGDLYRENEIRIFMERTILNPEYADERNWLIMGDTNCPSPLDAKHLSYKPDALNYLGHKYILENVPVTDLMKAFSCPDERDVFIRTMHRQSRIDMMYGSEAMTERMINAETPEDEYTRGSFNETVRFYDISSDHLPVIVDFAF